MLLLTKISARVSKMSPFKRKYSDECRLIHPWLSQNSRNSDYKTALPWEEQRQKFCLLFFRSRRRRRKERLLTTTKIGDLLNFFFTSASTPHKNKFSSKLFLTEIKVRFGGRQKKCKMQFALTDDDSNAERGGTKMHFLNPFRNCRNEWNVQFSGAAAEFWFQFYSPRMKNWTADNFALTWPETSSLKTHKKWVHSHMHFLGRARCKSLLNDISADRSGLIFCLFI